MTTEGKDYPAVFTMHGPSGSVHCCVKHARILDKLMQEVFGVRVVATQAPEGAQCSNCINEAKKVKIGPEDV